MNRFVFYEIQFVQVRQLYLYLRARVKARQGTYIYLFLTGHALDRRVKSPAYVHYMRILFLIATSRTDYDTRLMILHRSRRRDTHTRTQGLALSRIAQRSTASTEAIPDSFLNYRSFRSRGRLGASMFLSRDLVRDFCMRRGRTSRQSWWDKDRNPFGLEIYTYAFLYRKLFDSLNWDCRKNVPTRLPKRSRANFSALGLLLFSYRFLTNSAVRDNYPLIPDPTYPVMIRALMPHEHIISSLEIATMLNEEYGWLKKANVKQLKKEN